MAGEDHTSELWKHIGDLHRKHSELAIELHDQRSREGEAGASALDGHLGAIHDTLKEILAVIKQDLAEDKGEGKENKSGGRRGSGTAGGTRQTPQNP